MKIYLLMVNSSVGKIVEEIPNFDAFSINILIYNCFNRDTDISYFKLCEGTLKDKRISVKRIYDTHDPFYVEFINKYNKLKLLQ